VSPVARHGELELVYETHGDPGDSPLLLVSGYTRQLIGWSAELIAGLVAGGRFVITFDNRDCGLSSKLSERSVDLSALVAAAGAGDHQRVLALAPYTLSEMAGDAIAVLDALSLHSAHVLGASMGGMIAQTLAIEHPERVRSLISIMSRTGEPGYGESSREARLVLTAPPAADREAAIAGAQATAVWRSRRWPGTERERDLAARSWDRDHTPGGSPRQFAAMIASGSRADGLRRLSLPTLVIHGRDDTLIDPSGGERTAQLVPGAQLMLVDDMGHDMPVELLPELCAAILAHTDDERVRTD
jgi:pimeloyl-ACP methyl ester carboxylesterase